MRRSVFGPESMILAVAAPFAVLAAIVLSNAAAMSIVSFGERRRYGQTACQRHKGERDHAPSTDRSGTSCLLQREFHGVLSLV
jgi:hypothetical protein